MNSDEIFNWPDGDVILRSTRGTASRDFRVHKLILSLASPVFKDMFKIPQPSSGAAEADIVDLVDPPRAVELILRFIYPFPPPRIDNLTLLSEVLALTDKYDIEAARSQLRISLLGFARSEPLRVYAVAYQLGFQDEMKIASWYAMSINLPELAELPDEFRSIPATAYHHLILLHTRHHKKTKPVVARPPPILPTTNSSKLFLSVHMDEVTTIGVVVGAIIMIAIYNHL
jgi:hypothetical protein